MEKGKNEQSAASKTAEQARAAYQKAKDAHDKNANATNKAALEKAHTAMKEASKAENRERFIKVGTNRTKKARAAIRQLIKVANPKTYDFTPEEGAKIVAGLNAAVKEVEKAFSSTGKTAGAEDDFAIA